MDRGAWWARKELEMTERLSLSLSTFPCLTKVNVACISTHLDKSV